MNYLEDIKINKHDLDNEWVEQPELCLKYSDAHAQAEYDLAKAKEQLEVVRAQLDSRIREAAANRVVNGKPDPEKVTEAVVNNRIVLDRDYRTALAIYHEKQKAASMLKSAAITFATSRKEALENLVRLHLGNYYSKPMLAENRMAMDSVEQSSGYSSQVSGLNSAKKTRSEPGETFQSIPKAELKPASAVPRPAPLKRK